MYSNESTIKYYMKVKKPDGSYTNGKIDYTSVPEQLGLVDIDFAGLSVLDVAANDGFWTFWAEQQGAEKVLAIDIDSFEKYDWSWGGSANSKQVSSETPSQWKEAGAGFWSLHRAWSSNAERRAISVYDLHPDDTGMFDVIFNFGLLYHLRHPLLSLDRCRAVCNGVLILETHLLNLFDNYPASLFYRTDEAYVETNWCGPNESCVVNWLVSAGFPRVFSNKTNKKTPFARRIFVACIDDEWASKFETSSQLVEYDQRYLRRTRDETVKLLTPDREWVKKP